MLFPPAGSLPYIIDRLTHHRFAGCEVVIDNFRHTGDLVLDFDIFRNKLPKPNLGLPKLVNVDRRLAIVLDGELCTAPVIRSPIENGSGQISGHFDAREALELANLLEHPLEVPITLLESRPF